MNNPALDQPMLMINKKDYMSLGMKIQSQKLYVITLMANKMATIHCFTLNLASRHVNMKTEY